MTNPQTTPHTSGDAPAWRSAGAWVTLGVVTALGVAADLLSKAVAFRTIAGAPVVFTREDVLALRPWEIGRLVPHHRPITVVPHLLELQLVLNPGAVFGIGPGRRWFFVAFTGIAVAFALWVFAHWTTARGRLAHVALALVLAGGLGNLYDRLTYGCVRDFLHPLPGVRLPFGLAWPGGATELWPWVSNVADAFLLVGIALLLAALWRRRPEEHATAPPPDARA